MFKLFDLVFKSLRSSTHLQLVALFLLIIILSPSGILLCPKRRVLFRTNNVTWQRAAELALLSLGCQHRAEPYAHSGGDPHVEVEGLVHFCPSVTTGPVCELMPKRRSQTPSLEQPMPVFFLVRAVCLGKDMVQLRCRTCVSPSALIIHHCRKQDSRQDEPSVGPLDCFSVSWLWRNPCKSSWFFLSWRWRTSLLR